MIRPPITFHNISYHKEDDVFITTRQLGQGSDVHIFRLDSRFNVLKTRIQVKLNNTVRIVGEYRSYFTAILDQNKTVIIGEDGIICGNVVLIRKGRRINAVRKVIAIWFNKDYSSAFTYFSAAPGFWVSRSLVVPSVLNGSLNICLSVFKLVPGISPKRHVQAGGRRKYAYCPALILTQYGTQVCFDDSSTHHSLKVRLVFDKQVKRYIKYILMDGVNLMTYLVVQGNFIFILHWKRIRNLKSRRESIYQANIEDLHYFMDGSVFIVRNNGDLYQLRTMNYGNARNLTMVMMYQASRNCCYT